MRAPSLYSYFESQVAIHDAVFAQAHREIDDALHAAAETDIDPATDLHAWLTFGARRWLALCQASIPSDVARIPRITRRDETDHLAQTAYDTTACSLCWRPCRRTTGDIHRLPGLDRPPDGRPRARRRAGTRLAAGARASGGARPAARADTAARRSIPLASGGSSPEGTPGNVAVGELLDVVLTRDVWLHRIDICRAAGRPPEPDAAFDGRVVADVVAYWAARHGRPAQLHLGGPAGGHHAQGAAGPVLDLDAVEFCRVLSGRADAAGLLRTSVLFSRLWRPPRRRRSDGLTPISVRSA